MATRPKTKRRRAQAARYWLRAYRRHVGDAAPAPEHSARPIKRGGIRDRNAQVDLADKLRELLADAQDQRQSWIRQLEDSRAGEGHPRQIRLRRRITGIEEDIRDIRQSIQEVQGNAN